MRVLAIIAAFLALASCQPDEAAQEIDPLTEFGPGFADAQAAQCETQGGTFGAGGNGAMVCFRQTGEGTKSCSTSDDCAGACLARSRTCSPVTPLVGCNEVITSSGLAITQCLQ